MTSGEDFDEKKREGEEGVLMHGVPSQAMARRLRETGQLDSLAAGCGGAGEGRRGPAAEALGLAGRQRASGGDVRVGKDKAP